MLDVVIAGAGIAGLAAGISLRRAGHRVRIYERSAMNNEVGAAIQVPPNVSRFLVPWGLDPERAGFVRAGPVQLRDPFTLETTLVTSHDENPQRYGADLWYAHRVDLHDALRRQAVDPLGPGTPVAIHLESGVVRFDPDLPAMFLKNGEEIRADLIIGADGVHSIASQAVLGHENAAKPASHYNCCFRFLIPKDVLDEDPETRFFNKDADRLLRMFADNETSRRLVSYPCRRGTIHNFAGLFYDEEMKTATREDHHADYDRSLVLERFRGFNPSLLAVISKATEFKRWPLLYRAPLPTWRKGKLVLAGDAAHPTLPHHGQGGAQSIEDGVALGILLSTATGPSQIDDRLELYEKLRRNRASAIQILSNVGTDQAHLVESDLLPFVKKEDIPRSLPQIMNFNMGYDVIKEAVKLMKEFDPSFELKPQLFDYAASINTEKNGDSVPPPPESKVETLRRVEPESAVAS